LIPHRTLFHRVSNTAELCLSGIRPRRTSICYKMYTTLPLSCGVLYPARLSSMRSDTPQDFVLPGIRPSWQIKTPENQTKMFWELAFLFKGTLLKNCLHL
jgi:hypothetical protein